MDGRTIARFWSRVDKSAGEDGCWLWTAHTVHGYGNIRHAGKTVKAHRVSWELANGPIQDMEGYHGTCVLHRCDVRACCNPAHLFLGTNGDNVADKIAKGRQARQRGEDNPMAKLTTEAVAAMRADRSAGMLYRELGAKYGVSGVNARYVVTGKRWAHLSHR